MPKISELTYVDPISGFEEFPLVQSSTTKKIYIRDANKKPLIEIDLSLGFYNINPFTEYGNYYITTASPNKIILPPPSNADGQEIIICNYDQDNDAEFFGTFIPFIQSSTSTSEQYTKIPKKQVVKLISVNGQWLACSFALPGGATENYLVYSANITYDSINMMFFEEKFKDTFGDIALQYQNAGQYTITSAGGLFTAGKTQIFIGQNNNNGAAGNGNYVFYTCNWQNVSTILLAVFDVDVSNSDVYNADLMTDLAIEIRVYP